MRRKPLILGVIAIAVVGLYLGLIVAMRRNPVDERAIPPTTLKLSCAETPTTDDLERFLADLRDAIQSDDKRTLFLLTSHCEFSWWGWYRRGVRLRTAEDLQTIASGSLPREGWAILGVNPNLVFESEQDFENNYQTIFTPETKRRLLTGKFQPAMEGKYGMYYTGWRVASDGYYYLMVRRIKGIGFKLTGLAWEP